MSSVRGIAVLTGRVGTSGSAESESRDWFDASGYLGQRGTRLLPRGAQLTAACSTLLPEGGLGTVPDERRGIWVSTSTFAERMHEEMDALIRREGALALSPIQAPFFSVNLIAGRTSKDAIGKGMTTTITTPHTGFADALAAASAALTRGHVDRALVACTEVAASGVSGSGTEEGCVSVLLDRTHDDSVARISVSRGFAVDALRDLYDGSQTAPGDVASHGRHLIFTDREISDPILHAIVDLDGECIDAELRPLDRSMISQAVAVADLASSDAGGSVVIVSAAGQWARIHVSPPWGSIA